MAEFSISYAGITDAETRLYNLFKQIDDVSHDIQQTANKVSGAKSLENKGYATKIRVQGRAVHQTAHEIGTQGSDLIDISGVYSRTETRIVSRLSKLATTEAGFSPASAAILSKALANHKYAKQANVFSRALDETFDGNARYGRSFLEEFRYWRSTKGKEMVEKGVKAAFGEKGMNNYIVKEAIEDLNGLVEPWEDIFQAVLEPTDLDAVAKGGAAFAGMLGLGGFVSMASRYSNMTDAVGARAGEIAASGHPAKAVGYALAATGLETVQFLGDGVYNSGKFVLKKKIGKVFDVEQGGKLRKNASKASKKEFAGRKAGLGAAENTNDKIVGGVTDTVEGWFTDAGDWCWSRLDSAFGL